MMKLKQVSSFLTIAITLIFTAACRSEDEIESFIIQGDLSTVDFFHEFEQKEMTLISDEPFEDGRKIKYQNFFDLNDDSLNDIILIYEYFLSNSGDGYYFLKIEVPQTIQLTGALTRAFNSSGIFPQLLPTGAELGSNSELWTNYNNQTYLFYFEINNHLEVKQLNVFTGLNDAYLPFKIIDYNQDGIGWIHLEPTSEAWRPRLLDIGFKSLN